MTNPSPLIDVDLRRVVLASGTDHQYIYLGERAGTRLFPIMIGNAEANEIHRVVHAGQTARPLTHQLAFDLIKSLGGELIAVNIVDLKENTFYAQLVIEGSLGQVEIDARPSDAIALALRSRAPIRVAEAVLEAANETPDETPDEPPA